MHKSTVVLSCLLLIAGGVCSLGYGASFHAVSEDRRAGNTITLMGDGDPIFNPDARSTPIRVSRGGNYIVGGKRMTNPSQWETFRFDLAMGVTTIPANMWSRAQQIGAQQNMVGLTSQMLHSKEEK